VDVAGVYIFVYGCKGIHMYTHMPVYICIYMYTCIHMCTCMDVADVYIYV